MDTALGAMSGVFDPRVIGLLAIVTMLAKAITDSIKSAMVLPRWAPPVMAFALSIALVLMAMVAIGVTMTAQLAAQGAIVGMVAALSAVGVTSLQDNTKPSADAMVPLGATTTAPLADTLPLIVPVSATDD